MSSDYSNPSAVILPVDPIPVQLLSDIEPIEIIAQPCYTSKIRYRSDFESNKNRRGVLHSRNNPNYPSPTIRIPQAYLKATDQYYIRICLVTVVNEKTRCRYIHPYELEDIYIQEHNDPQTKSVWFPIQSEDIGGIKSFPYLRVVRKKADDLKNHGDFRVFESLNEDTTPQLLTVKETIKEFNLDKAQLAFTIGKKIIGNKGITYISYPPTTIFSDEMTESITVRSHSSRSSNCCMYKYAPRNGYTYSNDEVLIFYTNKLKPRKYGELQVTFEYDTPDSHWSESVLDLEIRDQMVSFRTPCFPLPIDKPTSVNIILRQRKRVFEPLKFHYIPIGQCPQCQRNTMENLNPVIHNNPNKRRSSDLYVDDEETDDVTPVCENNSEIQELNTELEATFFSTTMNEVVRICRSFIWKRPELLHTAISNKYSDLISKFIPVTQIDLLRQKNQFGKTILLHAVHLIRINIVQALLEKENSAKLLEDTNDKK